MGYRRESYNPLGWGWRQTAELVVLMLVVVLVVGVCNYRVVRREACEALLDTLATSSLVAVVSDDIGSERAAVGFVSSGAYLDLNACTYKELVALGFPHQAAYNVLAYRFAGGRFDNLRELLAIEGVDGDTYRRYSSHLFVKPSLAELGRQHKDSILQVREYQDKVYAALRIDLNKADVDELQQLKGVGVARAQQIVSYRHRLGGFVKVEQLAEITHFSMALVDSLRTHLVVDECDVEPIWVNRASVGKMRQHPYLDTEKAVAIYNLRKQLGTLSSIDDLKTLMLFTSDELLQLEPYLNFKPSRGNSVNP